MTRLLLSMGTALAIAMAGGSSGYAQSLFDFDRSSLFDRVERTGVRALDLNLGRFDDFRSNRRRSTLGFSRRGRRNSLLSGRVRSLARNVLGGVRGFGDRQLLKQLVHRLRQKIEATPAEPRYLVTVAGVGYVLDPEGGGEGGVP